MRQNLASPFEMYRSRAFAVAFSCVVVLISCTGGEGTEPGDDASGGSASSGGLAGNGGANDGGSTASGGVDGGSGGGLATGGTPNGGTLGTGGASGGNGSGGESGAGGPFPDGVTDPRIMIVGDSISAGPGCYKKYLAQELANNGYSHFEFVGQYEDDCGGGVRHSAVSCSTAFNFTQEAFSLPNCFAGETFPGMGPLMTAHNPDLVMIQLGVNDVWGGTTPVDSVLNNYSTLVEQARAANPNIVIVLAQIHRIITDNCTNSASTTNAEQLVNAVPAWAETMMDTSSPLFIADLWSNSDPYEADDCVHPNDMGARRMAGNWYETLKSILPRDGD